MKVFISWSGELSQLVALCLRSWIHDVIQIAEPYVSSEDLEKGSRWFAEVDKELGICEFGITCLTRENMNKPWVLFEAGAMSRSINSARVTPLLVDLTPADLSGPLAQSNDSTYIREPGVLFGPRSNNRRDHFACSNLQTIRDITARPSRDTRDVVHQRRLLLFPISNPTPLCSCDHEHRV